MSNEKAIEPFADSLMLRMLEGSEDPIFAVRARPDFSLVFVNDAAVRHFGWSRAELLQMSVSQFDPDFDAIAAERGLDAGVRPAYRLFEARHRTASGLEVPVEISSTLVRHEGDEYFFGTIRNISERKRAEEALQASEAHLANAERMARLGHWEIDLASGTVNASPTVSSIFDLPAGLAQSDPAALLGHVYPPDHDKVRAALRRLLETGEPAESELRIVAPSDRLHTAVVQAQVEQGPDGRPRRLFGTIQDVTERKTLETQYLRSQRMESMGMLAGGIAHDLNNILAPILMSAQLLRLKSADPSCRKLAETIENNTQRGADIVRKVLAFARGVRGEPIALPVRQVMKDILGMIEETFPRNIHLVSRIDTGVPPLRGDPTLVHQVLLNLCVNARDAMPGGGTLTLRATERHVRQPFMAAFNEARPGHYVCLHVKDTGIGIPTENLERIFEPFFSSKGPDGTGLGLPTVLGIVKGGGGFVEVRSTPGVGSEFITCFPAIVEEPPPPAPTPSATARGHGQRVLIIDDEQPIRDVLSEMLRISGFDVTETASGQEALAIFDAAQPPIDVVITDLMMPGMDGAKLITELRRRNPHLPIVAASGAASHPVLSRPVPTDASHEVPLLQKPFTLHSLMDTLGKVIPLTR